MVKYPHILTCNLFAEGLLGTNGEYEVDASQENFTCECRSEGNPRGQYKTLHDGTQYIYKSIIFLKPGSAQTPVGSKISVMDSDSVTICEGIVTAYQRHEKGAKVWL